MPRRSEGASLDPDVLSELERERDFLLRSLDDLDAEQNAGDLDVVDFENLSDDYTARLAEVARAITEEREAFARVENRLTGRQRALTIAAVALVAILAGVFLARASGFRSPSDSLSGDIRRSSAGLLSEADTLTREGRWEEAIDKYDEALDLSPANAEALTYRGWLTARLGDPATGLIDLADAVSVDPEFPDARVFNAILLDDEQRFDEAGEQLAALDLLDAPPEILGLVAGSDLRASVAAGQIKQKFGDGTAIDLTMVTATLDDVARAGALFFDVGDGELAVRAFDAVLEEDPNQLVALVGKGQLARDATMFEIAPEIAADALERLDEAVAIDPDSVEIRLYRADARAVQGDLAGARVDLDAIDAALVPDNLVGLYDALNASIPA